MNIYRCKYRKAIREEQFSNAAAEVKLAIDSAISLNGIDELNTGEFSQSDISFDLIETSEKDFITMIARFHLERSPENSTRVPITSGVSENTYLVANAFRLNGELLIDTVIRIIDRHTDNALYWLPIPSPKLSDYVDFEGFRFKDPRPNKSKGK